MTQIIGLIKNNLPDLSKTMSRLASFVLANTTEVSKMSISELADASYISPATVTRFCRMLDLSFVDFRTALAVELAVRSDYPKIQGQIQSPEESSVDLLKSTAEEFNRNIRFAVESSSLADIHKAAEMISHSSHVEIYGTGISSVASLDLQRSLYDIGISCHSVIDAYSASRSADRQKKGTVIVAISISGENPQTLEFLARAKQAEAYLIVLTSRRSSSLSSFAKITIPTPYIEDGHDPFYYSARVSQLLAIRTLVLAVSKIL